MARDKDAGTSESTSALGEFVARRWLSLLILLLMAIFVIQNHDSVGIHVLTWSVHAPMWLVLVITFVAGVLAGAISTRRSLD